MTRHVEPSGGDLPGNRRVAGQEQAGDAQGLLEAECGPEIITSNGFPLFTHAGTIGHEQMRARAGELYGQFDQERKRQEAIADDARDEADLQALHEAIKRGRKP